MRCWTCLTRVPLVPIRSDALSPRLTITAPSAAPSQAIPQRDARGYGLFWMQACKRPLRAPRLSYALTRGPIPNGLLVCHHCDNPCCVRPDHLFLGTVRDNFFDAIRKGRHPGFVRRAARSA
jgi:hypothetical protein